MSEVGSGPKSADDLDYDGAYEAFVRMLEDRPDSITLGGFWIANRWKGNTPDELAGFVDAMRDGSVETAEPAADPIDCGANYDGKSEFALLGVAAGLVAAAAGTPVAVHSADRVPTNYGFTYGHVLDALGVKTDLAPEESAAMLDEVGFGFYYQPNFNPGVHAQLEHRDSLGVRTFLNTIETLANPANATVHLGSFFHRSFGQRVADTLHRSESQNVEQVVLFRGQEGYDDVRPGRNTVVENTDGTVDERTITAADVGLDIDRDTLLIDDEAHGPVTSARITEEAVSPDGESHFQDAVVLNAAVRIYAAKDVDSIVDGIECARRAIQDGRAEERLTNLRTTY